MQVYYDAYKFPSLTEHSVKIVAVVPRKQVKFHPGYIKHDPKAFNDIAILPLKDNYLKNKKLPDQFVPPCIPQNKKETYAGKKATGNQVLPVLGRNCNSKTTGPIET